MDFLRSNEEGMRGEALYKGGLTRSPAGMRQAPPVARRMGDRPPGACRLGRLVGRLRGGRQGPVARWGRQAPSFFSSRDFVANLKKKNTFELCRPPIGRPGYIFEILIFFKYKKEKTA